MNSINKKGTGLTRAVAHAPQIKPRVAQLKTAVSAPNVKRPVAPPVYRPQATPKVLQRKSSSPQNLHQAPPRPIASPVNRPQPAPKVLQTKSSVTPPPRNVQAPPKPVARVAPPVYRPQTVPRVLQAKIAPAQARLSAKPNQPQVIQPMLSSIASAIGSFFGGAAAPPPPPPAPPPPLPIDTLSELPEHLRGKSEQEIVDYVFRRFCEFGWEYDVSQDFGSAIIGTAVSYQHGDVQANCRALANAFGMVLQRLHINVELATVREPVAGRRFVVKLKRFIDPQVKGNIKNQYGQVMTGYYLFREHYAVWVPRARKYYDPMAKATYTDIKPFIAWELVALDGDEDDFVSTDGRYLFHLSNVRAPGNFYYYEMEEVGRKEVKTYHKVLKSKGYQPKKRQ